MADALGFAVAGEEHGGEASAEGSPYWLVVLSALLLAGCATVKNTPQQDYVWAMGRVCDERFRDWRMDRVDPDGHSHIQPVTVSMTGGDWGQYVDCLNAQFRAHPYREWVQRNIVASSEDKGKPTAPGDATKTPAQTQLAQPQVSVARPPASILPQPGGEPIPLDTAEPKYQDYFNKVRERIKAKWVYPLPAGERGIEGELLIEFHIAKDGRLEFIELRRSSGTQILDDAALTAVRQAQPFAPVPDDVAKRSLVINGSFRYTITRP